METEEETGGDVSISQGVQTTTSHQKLGEARKDPLLEAQRKQGSADTSFQTSRFYSWETICFSPIICGTMCSLRHCEETTVGF